MVPNPFAQALATDLRQLHYGKNWTAVSITDVLQNLSLEQALQPGHAAHSIAVLLAHTHYYVKVQLQVLSGGPLAGKDSESFALPPLQTPEQWESMKQSIFTDADALATQIEQLKDEDLFAPFTHEKYGSYYRNLAGLIQHTHYHLGQMMLLKKYG